MANFIGTVRWRDVSPLPFAYLLLIWDQLAAIIAETRTVGLIWHFCKTLAG